MSPMRKLLCLFLLTHPLLALGLPSDSKEKMHVTADYSHGDMRKHIVTHKGRVVVTQGTTRLTAATLTVYLTEKKELLKMVAIGKPATYRTLTAMDKPEFYAEGDEIHYFADKKRVWLIGNAKVRQGGHAYAGHRLEYFTEEQVVISPRSPKGRASMIITPPHADHT